MAKSELIAVHNTMMEAAVVPQTGKHKQPERFDSETVALIKRTVCKGASDDELKLFMHQAVRTGLDPLARQIYAIKRWDNQAKREVMGIQVSIDGFRLIAERTGKYAGQLGPFWCDNSGQWWDVWTDNGPPTAARIGVLRTDFKEPCWGVARFNAYAQKKSADGSLTRMWATMGDVMIAKCAESLALRKAFPQELSGLYSAEEMEQAEEKRENPDDKSALEKYGTTAADIVENEIQYDADGHPIDSIPHGDDGIERLSKAMGKPEYAKLSSDIKSAKALTDLANWGRENRNRVESLPLDWQAILRDEYRTRQIELGWKPKELVS